MSDIGDIQGRNDLDGAPGRWGRDTTGTAIGVAVAAGLGLAVWLVGLPHDPQVFGGPLSDLTVEAALVVALAGISVVGALRQRSRWRVVDMVVASVLAVAGGLFFWGVATGWTWMTETLRLAPPSSALLAGFWVLPAVLGGLVIRRPGAAVFVELVAAVLEALLGNQWGFATVYYGLIEGLGAEFVLALLFYRAFGPVAALLAGAGAGLAEGLLDITVTYPTLAGSTRLAYVLIAAAASAVVAGGGAWALTRALASTGALAPLASGGTAERV